MAASPDISRPSKLEATANLLAPAFILSTPFVTYLRYHGYDLLATEALICLAGFTALGLLIGALIEIRPETLRPVVLLALTLPWTLALARAGLFSALDWIALWSGIGAEHYRTAGHIAFGVIGLVAVAFWLMRRHIGLIVATVFGVMLAVATTGSSGTERQIVRAPAPPPLRADLPPIVHLVLDEHIGVAGIPEDVPGGRELKRDIVAFYERHGFRLYPNAFSHYFSTEDSLANLLNGAFSPVMHADIEGSDKLRILRNRWFDSLGQRGYRIEVVQSDYLDFCAENHVVECSTYPASSVGALQSDPDVTSTTAALAIVQSYLERPLRYAVLAPLYEKSVRPAIAAMGLESPTWNWDRLIFGPVATKQALAKLPEALSRRPQGRLFFAHLLLPHHTYMYGADCAVEPDIFEWQSRATALNYPETPNTSAERATRYRAYFRQMRCTYRLLDRLFAAMRSGGGFDRATIYIHGDHGSRIALKDPLPENADALAPQDLVDGYSTLFAVRGPNLAPLVSLETRSIQDLFAEHALEEPARKENRRVFLMPLVKNRLSPLFAPRLEFDVEATNQATAGVPPR